MTQGKLTIGENHCMMVTAVQNAVNKFGQKHTTVVNKVSFLSDDAVQYDAEYLTPHDNQTDFVQGKKACFSVNKYSKAGTPEIVPAGMVREDKPADRPAPAYAKSVSGTSKSFGLGYAKDIVVALIEGGNLPNGQDVYDDATIAANLVMELAGRFERWLENEPAPDEGVAPDKPIL